jgi:hypothetical protein
MQHATLEFDGTAWGALDFAPSIIIAFLDPQIARDGKAWTALRAAWPNSVVVGCSTGGEIASGRAFVGRGFAAALSFDAVTPVLASGMITGPDESRAVGRDLAQQLASPDLCGIYVLSDGARVNGSELVAGFREVLGADVPLNGGLAGDGDRFGETLVGCGADLVPGQVVAVGFHGTGLTMRSASFGGWEVFGPKRKITRASGNVLHELDDKSALELYKRYLGEEAENLPGSALLFPLQITPPSGEGAVVRTILGIDEATGAMTFAGDMPEGWTAQLMMGDPGDLIDGARIAGGQVGHSSGFALLVSCIGRRLVLGQRASEEVRAVVEALGDIAHAGFYSYGEISPNGFEGSCSLHNQTMTVTVFEAA